MLVTAAFASAADMLMNAYLPGTYKMMGIYLALIAVDLLAFGAAENSAKAGLGKALADAAVTGIYFAVVILVVAALRELFGSGSFAGNEIAFLKDHAVPLLNQASGGFVILAFAAAVVNKLCRGCCLCQGKGLAFSAAGLDDGKAPEKEEE